MSRTSQIRELHPKQAICCLLALEIADYDAKPVFDQVRLTQEFHHLLDESTAAAGPDDCVSVVGEGTALLGFFSNAPECFTTALMIREATLTQDRYRDLPLRFGINLGQAELADDEFGNPQLGGQGRQDADRLMRLGPPRQISVARQFVEVLSRSAPDLADLLEYQGPYSDAVGPPLCLYKISPPQIAAEEDDAVGEVLEEPELASSEGQVIRAKHVTSADKKKRPHLWLAYPLLAIAAAAVLYARPPRIESPPLNPLQPTASAPPAAKPPRAYEDVTQPSLIAPTPEAVDSPTKQQVRRIKRTSPAERKTAVAVRPEEPSQETSDEEVPLATSLPAPTLPPEPMRTENVPTGTVLLAVKPWGEVYVDGIRVGITPPLRSFSVPSGRHRITVTNSDLPVYQKELTVEADSQIRIVHDFTCISVRDMICREGFGKGTEVRSRFEVETADASSSRPPRE